MEPTLNEMSDCQVVEAYKNARTTFYQALGHSKAGRNEVAMGAYKAEIVKRGMPLPPDSDKGVFNGFGSR